MQIETSPSAHRSRQKVSIRKRGFSWIPATRSRESPRVAGEIYDCIVVGGGLSGLTAAYELRGKKVLVLEASPETGGIAAYGQTDGLLYSRGGVYSAKPTGRYRKLLDELGVPDNQHLEVPEPTDSTLYQGKLIKNFMKEGVQELPPEFARFFNDLKEIAEKFEEPITHPELDALARHLDSITAAQFIKPYGKEVKKLLDLYSMSTFGPKTNQISALAFLSFYHDELFTKYAFQSGTSGIALALEKKLREASPESLLTRAVVSQIRNTPEGMVEVTYRHRGRMHKRLAKTVIVATPLVQASRMVKDMAPEKKPIIEKMRYCSYIVHNVVVPEPVYKDSYITWVPDRFFTDFVASSWVKTKGYTIRQEGRDTVAIYNPLPPQYWNKKMTFRVVRKIARKALTDLKEIIPALKSVKHLTVESSVWAPALPIVYPGFLTKDAPVLRQRDGKIFYAGQNLSLPCVEGAINTALDAADQARALLEDRAHTAQPERKPWLLALTRGLLKSSDVHFSP